MDNLENHDINYINNRLNEIEKLKIIFQNTCMCASVEEGIIAIIRANKEIDDEIIEHKKQYIYNSHLDKYQRKLLEVTLDNIIYSIIIGSDDISASSSLEKDLIDFTRFVKTCIDKKQSNIFLLKEIKKLQHEEEKLLEEKNHIRSNGNIINKIKKIFF